MNTWDYIERVRAANDGCSDYRIAQLLNITRGAISLYKAGTREADDEVAAKIGVLLDMPPALSGAQGHHGRSEG